MVKSIIQQFDLPKSKKTSDDSDEDDPVLDVATMELLKLAGDIDLEEHMMENELKKLAASVQPVWLLLTKVTTLII